MRRRRKKRNKLTLNVCDDRRFHLQYISVEFLSPHNVHIDMRGNDTFSYDPLELI